MIRLSKHLSGVSVLAVWLCITQTSQCFAQQSDNSQTNAAAAAGSLISRIQQTGKVLSKLSLGSIANPISTTRASATGLRAATHAPRIVGKEMVLDAVPTRCAEGLCSVRKDGLWGFVDYQGKVVLDFQFHSDLSPYFSQGLCRVSASDATSVATGGYIYIDRQGHPAFQRRVFYGATEFKDGTAVVVEADGPKVLDIGGSMVRVLPDVFLKQGFHEGFIAAGNQGAYGSKVGFRNQKMEWAIEPRFNEVRNFNEGMAWVSSVDAGGVVKWGAVDAKGNLVVPFRFSKQPDQFSDGLAAVECSNSKKGYVDVRGNLVLDCQYTRAAQFVSGHALVFDQAGTRLIDKAGRMVADGKGSSLDVYATSTFQLREDGLYLFYDRFHGLLDGNLRIVIPAVYGTIGLFPPDNSGDGLAWATSGTTEGLINRHGDFVVLKINNKF